MVLSFHCGGEPVSGVGQGVVADMCGGGYKAKSKGEGLCLDRVEWVLREVFDEILAKLGF